ncbi:hypothetical protein [Paenibacillus glycanilyticus]|uniref:Uncharacterized protein n=1 Tax=Paenibacillus glycanilyticus TaxID=126569 RepID=A0ABQ6NPV9_9BACL|nr:hypothetical protein [Paenibacillus glycanilyticus]GMK47112.1 hypothetical protein PghCCS26_42420 [Paenibacillus glycanilyticus]
MARGMKIFMLQLSEVMPFLLPDHDFPQIYGQRPLAKMGLQVEEEVRWQ